MKMKYCDIKLNTIEEFISLVLEDPIKFRNNYFNAKRYNKDLYKTVEFLLNSIGAEDRQFYKIAYDIKHNFEKPNCLLCGKQVEVFKNREGYAKYCSGKCASNAPNKMSPEKSKAAAKKRTAKILSLYEDPIKGPELRRKIGRISSINNAKPEVKAKQSISTKLSILEGRFTPNITNSWTRWKTQIDGKKFRSSFEGLFHLYHNYYKGRNILFEKLRIPYNFNGSSHIYIVDFIDPISRKVFEIKPENLIDSDKNISKQNALSVWCEENSHSFTIISEPHLKAYLNEMLDNNFNHSFLDDFQKLYKWVDTNEF